MRIVLVAVATAVGWLGPNLYLYQKVYDRSKRMQRELPDAIDLMTISVESGLGFDAAVQQVARNTEGPLADEFSRVLREMQIGQGRAEALRGLAERTEVDDLKSFVTSMVQADSFGIPIANVLRIQSSEIRIKRRQRAEEQAQKVPVKITVPLIFCILPCPVHRGDGSRRHPHHGLVRRGEVTERPMIWGSRWPAAHLARRRGADVRAPEPGHASDPDEQPAAAAGPAGHRRDLGGRHRRRSCSGSPPRCSWSSTPPWSATVAGLSSHSTTAVLGAHRRPAVHGRPQSRGCGASRCPCRPSSRRTSWSR